jgi:hypothetical protein
VRALGVHVDAPDGLLIVVEACGAVKNLAASNEFNKVSLHLVMMMMIMMMMVMMMPRLARPSSDRAMRVRH